MAIDFPNAPVNGDEYTVGNQTYVYVSATNSWELKKTPALGGSSGIQVASLGVGTTPSGTQGEIRATNEITAYYSDGRLKTILSEIDNALTRVRLLRGVRYIENAKANELGYDSGRVHVGVIAQDVQSVLPEAIRPAPFDVAEDGSSKSGENYLTVQYEKIIPLLIQAIKELADKVEGIQ
jgi:hypothetical protein